MQRTNDSDLKFNKQFSESDNAKRGKVPFISPTVTTTDIPASTSFLDHENCNDLNVKTDYSGYTPSVAVSSGPKPEPSIVTG